MEQHKIQDGIQIQILFLETTFMDQQIKIVIHQIHFIQTGGLLRLLLIIAATCAVFMATILAWPATPLMTIPIGSLCLLAFRCSVECEV